MACERVSLRMTVLFVEWWQVSLEFINHWLHLTATARVLPVSLREVLGHMNLFIVEKLLMLRSSNALINSPRFIKRIISFSLNCVLRPDLIMISLPQPRVAPSTIIILPFPHQWLNRSNKIRFEWPVEASRAISSFLASTSCRSDITWLSNSVASADSCSVWRLYLSTTSFKERGWLLPFLQRAYGTSVTYIVVLVVIDPFVYIAWLSLLFVKVNLPLQIHPPITPHRKRTTFLKKHHPSTLKKFRCNERK